MHQGRSLAVLALVAQLLVFSLVGQAAAEAPKHVRIPEKLTPILTLDDVRVGMKGYGMSVFHGAKIEPFEVEVISVARDFGPSRGVIWIRCPDARMQLSGPVQGMSGSPIYLWDTEGDHKLGEGGKLIGAFAFGYGMSKDCFAGVQPIELMRLVGERTTEEKPGDKEKQAAAQLSRGSRLALLSLDRLIDSAGAQGKQAAWQAQQAKAIRDLLAASMGEQAKSDKQSASAPILKPSTFTQDAFRLQLPLAVRAPGAVDALQPLLDPLGIRAMQVPAGTQAGLPPHDVTADDVMLEPGSVLSIPLAWGDLDMSASGTVTEVLPDGRVLAFGHAMNGEGDTTLPMATGYVHLVMPSIQTSFKIGGSLNLLGAVRRDEASAIAGLPAAPFETAKARVSVKLPNQEPEIFNYTLARHSDFTPLMAAIAALESIGAQQSPPMENTAHLKAELTFTHGYKLSLDTLLPNAQPINVVLQMYPALMVLANNPYEKVLLTDMKVDVVIEENVRLTTIQNGHMDRNEVAPGDKLGMSIELQPYGKDSFEKRISFTVPESLPDGDYFVQVCDARTYAGVMGGTRPHLMRVTNIDEMFAMVKRAVTVKTDALYVIFHMNQEGVAVGRQEMPRLPSSFKTMIASPTSTVATPYMETTHKMIPMDFVPQGEVAFQLTVRNDLKKN